MNPSLSPAALQAAMTFLLGRTRDDAIGLPAAIDYPALAARAAASGFDTDAAAIEQAFRLLMRMRNARRSAPGSSRPNASPLADAARER